MSETGGTRRGGLALRLATLFAMLAALPAVLGGWTTQRLVREARTRAAAESVQLRLARVDTILEQAARDVRSSLGRLASSLERNETTRLSALAAGGAAVVEEAARLGAGTDLDLLTVLDAEERVISSWHWPQLAGLGARSLAGLDAARGVVRRVEGPRRARPAIVARYPLGGGRLSVVGGRWIDERIVEAVASGRGAWLVDLDPRGAGKLEFGRVPSIEAEARGVISAADAPRGPILAGRWAVGRFDLRDDRGPLGAALYIAVPLEPDRFVAGAVAAVGALAILLAALVGVWTARRISRPVDRLVQAVDAIAAGEADYALPGLVDDQFERLAAAFSRLQRSLERQQRRAAAAERIAAWREAARRVAHEVKNPLAPIRLTVENLQRAREGHPELFDELFREGTRTILDEVEQLRRLVTEFSEFARLPAPRPRAVDVHELIEGVLELHAAEPGLEIVRAFRARPALVRADPDQLRRALTNVVGNAIEAMRGEAAPHLLELSTALEDGMVEIVVCDNGAGIPPELVDKVFEPYVTTKAGGTGLGMAVVERIVSEHDGDVEAANRPEGGVRIRIRVPPADPAGEA